MTRRHFLRSGVLVGGTLGMCESGLGLPRGASADARTLFDGATLHGWHAAPRLAVPKSFDDQRVPAAELKHRVEEWYAHDPVQRAKLAHHGRWQVVDGAIVGGQEPA